MNLSYRFPIILICSIALTFVVIWLPGIPLGIVSADETGARIVEWVWARHAAFADVSDFFARILWPTFAAACLIFVARRGIKVLTTGPRGNGTRGNGTRGSGSGAKVSRVRCCVSYLLLMAASVQWIVAVQQSAASPHKELKPLWVLYDPGASGYFFEAAFQLDDTNEFLKGYEDRMAEGDVLHIGTHPPGMFLLAKSCISICEHSSTVRQLVSLLTASSTTDAFRFVEKNARLQRPLREEELAGLQLLSLGTLLMAVLTIIPLSLLSMRLFTPSIAWTLCCLWPTVPAISVFLPKSDLLFPVLSVALLLLAVIGCRSIGRAIVVGIPAGAILLLAATLSLAILPTVAAIAVFLILMVTVRPPEYRKPVTALILAVVCSFGGLVFLIHQMFQCNLLAIFEANLHNHAGFYDQFPRTWWKWLLVNPVELSFTVGLPILILAASPVSLLKNGCPTSLDNDQDPPTDPTREQDSPHGQNSRLRQEQTKPFLTALAVTIALLWLSGKNNGEAARLWCFLTPWVLLLAGPKLGNLLAPRTPQQQQPPQQQNALTWLLIAQLTICLMTVSRVSGFSF